jgi:hypothetical protein
MRRFFSIHEFPSLYKVDFNRIYLANAQNLIRNKLEKTFVLVTSVSRQYKKQKALQQIQWCDFIALLSPLG